MDYNYMIIEFYLNYYKEWKKDKENKEFSWLSKRTVSFTIAFIVFILSFINFFISSCVICFDKNIEPRNSSIRLVISTIVFFISIGATVLLDDKWRTISNFPNFDTYLLYCERLHNEKLKSLISSCKQYENILQQIKKHNSIMDERTKQPVELMNKIFMSIIFALILAVIPPIIEAWFNGNDLNKITFPIIIIAATFCLWAIFFIISIIYCKAENNRLQIYKQFERDIETIIDISKKRYKGHENNIKFE